MKKLLVLGGDRFTIPVIEAAHKQGYYVITCDYLPDNIAHKISDEYINYSTTDKDGILAWSKKNKIDGVITFTDSGVITCGYLRHHLNLPMLGPQKSVEILQNKDKFREFLRINKFNVPKAKGYSNIDDAVKDFEWFNWPVMVKPTDSAGSKGCTRVDKYENFEDALILAMSYSTSKQIIVEDFIEKERCSSDSDCFTVDGKLAFVSFSAQYFDNNTANPYAPAAYCWPSTFTKEQECELISELQRLISLLEMKTTVYNVETRVGINGKPYIMEVSPRGGGNRLSEMVRLSTGVDLITAAVRAAVGDSIGIITQKPLNGFWAEIILHSDKDGEFQSLVINEDMHKHVFEIDLWVSPGTLVEAFSGANKAIGTLILHFKDENVMVSSLMCQNEWLKVVVS